jgi:hypothetical protein
MRFHESDSSMGLFSVSCHRGEYIHTIYQYSVIIIYPIILLNYMYRNRRQTSSRLDWYLSLEKCQGLY